MSANRKTEFSFYIATLGSNLDSKSKLGSEEQEWVIKSHLTNPPPTRNMDVPLVKLPNFLVQWLSV